MSWEGPERWRGAFFVAAPERSETMECAVAIQVLPIDATCDEEVCRIVDEVIAYLETLPVSLFVGPFETTIEGDYDTCLDALKECQLVAARAGARKVMTYAKVDYRPEGDLLTTERKVGKYAEVNAASGLAEAPSSRPASLAAAKAVA